MTVERYTRVALPMKCHLLISLALILLLPQRAFSQQESAAQYVGAKACAECHPKESAEWKGSNHDLAMQVATPETVLGDFSNTKFEYAGVTTTFFKRQGKFFVNTDGPNGKIADFEITHTFGVYPLQQYLITLSGGRRQAFGIAWDARPKDQGGQRWFHLYPEQKLSHKNALHWTGIDQNWNYQCAACHSTNLQKHYDPAKRTFATTWSEINVACESCHGPGSKHVELAKSAKSKDGALAPDNNGLAVYLTVHLTERAGAAWKINEATGIASRSTPLKSNFELDTCAQCHSRRGSLTENVAAGRSLLDTHRPAFLDDGLYFPDGQIRDEVYEYGSFVQSKMHAAGVTCSDCHNPHTLKLRVNADAVCSQCHAPGKFAVPEHHHHTPGSAGASCLGCHMPQRTYMGVDLRRDHSFRVPRPDLTEGNGSPNACAGCHAKENAQFTVSAFKKWYVPRDSWFRRYGEAFHAARQGVPSAEAKLLAIAQDSTIPAIARGTALKELQRYLNEDSFAVVQRGLTDKDPLVRLGALTALVNVDPKLHVKQTVSLLNDPVLAVRIEAAARLAGVPPGELNQEQQRSLDVSIQEYIAATMANAERPEEQLNLGLLFARLGKAVESEKHYREAIRIDPDFAPAYVNLADLFRVLGRDKEGEKLLRNGVIATSNDPTVEHTLALLLVREKRNAEALQWFERAAQGAPQIARYSFIYAVALQSAGQVNKALEVLGQAHQQHPNDIDILSALVSMNRETGNDGAAQLYAQKLSALNPRHFPRP